MSGGDFSRIGIPIGLDSTIREDLARIRGELTQGVQQLSQAATVRPAGASGAAPTSAQGGGGGGGSYNYVAGQAAGGSLQRTPFNLEAYREGAHAQLQQSMASLRAAGQPMGAALQEYESAMSPQGIAAARSQHAQNESARIQAERDAQRQQRTRDHLADRQETRYENRLASDMGRERSEAQSALASELHGARYSSDRRFREQSRLRNELEVNASRLNREDQAALSNELTGARRAGTQTFRQEQQYRSQVEANVLRQSQRQERDEGWYARDQIRANIQENRTRVSAQNRQERDEGWLVRDEIRQRRQETRQQITGQNRQERDENWAVRDEIRAQRTQQRQQLASQNRQERDEQWFSRDQIREQRQAQRGEVRDQNRQNRDENFVARRDMREARQTEEADLRLRVSQRWTRGGRAREYEAYAQQFAPDSPEYTQNMARGQEERNRGFFGRPQGRAVAFQIMFGAWEAGRALQGVGAMQQLPGMGTTELMSAQQQGLQMMQGGIYGSMVGGALAIGDLATGGQGWHGKIAGVGVASPLSTMMAMRNAITGMRTVEARTQGMLTVKAAQGDIQSLGMMNPMERDPLAQQSIQNDIRFDEQLRGMEAEELELNQRLADANTEGDGVKIAQAVARIQAYNKTSKQRKAAYRSMYKREGAAIQESSETRERQMDQANTATFLALQGETFQSEMAGLDAAMGGVKRDANGLVVQIGEVTPADLRWQQTLKQYALGQRSVTANEDRRNELSYGSHQASLLRRSNHPVQAQIREVESQRDAALIGMTAGTPEYKRITQNAQDRIAEIEFEAEKEDRGIGRELSAEHRQINILLGKGGMAGMAMGTRSGVAAALAIADAGRERAIGLEESGHGQRAVQALINTQGLINVRRQEYLDNIRGTEFDVRHRDMTNMRDTEDSGAILQGFKEAGKEITHEMERIIANAIP